MHIISFLRKVFFLIIWLASLFIIVPSLVFVYSVCLSTIPFFIDHELITNIVIGLLLTISLGLIFGLTIFLVKRLFKFKTKSQGGE